MDADTVLQGWHDRSGEYSPDYYAYYGPNETSELINDRLDAVVDPDAAILELGCSSGRHLAHLHDHGYQNLWGIDINGDALDVMRQTYPDLASAGTFHFDAIENVITDFDDGQFDVVFSVETLQHIHQDNAWVFEEVARVAGDLLITVELERDDGRASVGPPVTYVNDDFPLYYRNWRHIFTDLGFVEKESEKRGRDTFRLFRRAER